jgi:Ca-activated chloride channel family protein
MSGLFESLTGLHLLAAGHLLWVPVVLLAVWLGRRRPPAIPLAAAAFLGGADLPAPEGKTAPLPTLPRTRRQRLSAVPDALQALGLAGIALALARPVQRTPLPETTAGIDIVLCLDVSSSMQETDLDPARARFAVAQAAAAQFIAGRPRDRIALLSFARFPDLRCPLTLDHAALRELLAETEMVGSETQEDATGIGTALARAAHLLRDSEAAAKVAIVLTDGEENVATAQTREEIAPLHAAQLCRELGIRVHTIAVGVGQRAGDGSLQPLDTTALQRVAERTRGRFHAAADAAALGAVYAEIDGLERAPLAEPRYRVEERFLPFVAAGGLLLLLARLLRASVLAVLP